MLLACNCRPAVLVIVNYPSSSTRSVPASEHMYATVRAHQQCCLPEDDSDASADDCDAEEDIRGSKQQDLVI